MTPAEALADVRGYATANRIRVEPHAWKRMRERNVPYRDLRNALTNAATCRAAEEPGRWRVEGPDLDGDSLEAIVVIEDGVIVVTVF